ncbi:hypothetical protein ACQEWB_03915 [Streptomyces sp. CA-249302]|uniref:hypothetical protein n=1 Tax=Streptomyces sp. CA-249302 TaxID=3240058 RepID=UPI003D944708
MSQQATPGRTDRIPSTVRLARGAALIGGLALLPLATACSGGEGGGEADKARRTSVSAAPEAGVVAPAKVEVIAGLIGCAKPKIRVEAEELRQGVCHTKQADRVITTFPEEKYKLAWLDAASGYGGQHLVGARWVVSAKPELLKAYRDKLGGDIQQMRGFGPTAAPSAS